MSEKSFGNTTLAQVAIVVRDIEEASRRYADLLGQPVPEVITTEPGLEVNMTYKGKPSNAQTRLAFFHLGPVELELVQPLGGQSSWQDGLDRHGEGFHHLAFWVEGMQKSVDFLKERGIPMEQRGDMGPGQYAYFNAEATLGITLELLEQVRQERAHS